MPTPMVPVETANGDKTGLRANLRPIELGVEENIIGEDYNTHFLVLGAWSFEVTLGRFQQLFVHRQRELRDS